MRTSLKPCPVNKLNHSSKEFWQSTPPFAPWILEMDTLLVAHIPVLMIHREDQLCAGAANSSTLSIQNTLYALTSLILCGLSQLERNTSKSPMVDEDHISAIFWPESEPPFQTLPQIFSSAGAVFVSLVLVHKGLAPLQAAMNDALVHGSWNSRPKVKVCRSISCPVVTSRREV